MTYEIETNDYGLRIYYNPEIDVDDFGNHQLWGIDILRIEAWDEDGNDVDVEDVDELERLLVPSEYEMVMEGIETDALKCVAWSDEHA